MNELEQINAQLADINNKRVRYQTLKDQAIQQCRDIEQKYGVRSLEELEALVNQANVAYQQSVEQARQYIDATNSVFASYQGII